MADIDLSGVENKLNEIEDALKDTDINRKVDITTIGGKSDNVDSIANNIDTISNDVESITNGSAAVHVEVTKTNLDKQIAYLSKLDKISKDISDINDKAIKDKVKLYSLFAHVTSDSKSSSNAKPVPTSGGSGAYDIVSSFYEPVKELLGEIYKTLNNGTNNGNTGTNNGNTGANKRNTLAEDDIEGLSDEDKKILLEKKRKAKEKEAKEYRNSKSSNRIRGISNSANNGISYATGIADGDSKGTTGKVIGSAGSTLMQTGNPWAMAGGAVLMIVSAIFNKWSEIQKAAQDYSRTIGGGINGMKRMQVYSAQLVTDNKLALKYGLGQKDVTESITNYQKELGVTVSQTNKGWEQGIIMMKKMNIQAKDLASLDLYGVDLESANKLYGAMYNLSTKSGISFQKTSENLSKNLNLASQYTFKNAVGELTTMANRAAAIHWDMQQTARVADKVNTLEGATQVSAQLSVLGGAFSQFAQPLSLLHDSLNDFGNLEDKITGMFGSFGKYNKETKQVEVSAYDKRMIREASNVLGTDYGTVMETVNRTAKMNYVEKQLKEGKNYKSLDKDMIKYIKNIASINEEGKAYVSLTDKNGNTTDVDIKNLTRENKEQLEKIAEYQAKDDMAKVAEKTRTLDDKVQGIFSFLTNGLFGFMIKKWGSTEDKNEIYEDAGKVNKNKFLAAKGVTLNEAEAEKAGTYGGNGEDKRVFINSMESKYKGLDSEFDEILKWKMFRTEDRKVKEINDYFDRHKEELEKRYTAVHGSNRNNSERKNRTPYLNDDANRHTYAKGDVNIGNVLDGSNGYFKFNGPTHSGGGIPIEVEGGESIMNRISTSRFGNVLKTMNDGSFLSKWKPINPMKVMNFDTNRLTLQNAGKMNDLGTQSLGVNFGEMRGELKITSDGRSVGLDINSLFNNNKFKEKIIEMIAQNMNIRNNSGRYNKKEDYNRSVWNG